MTPIGSRGDVQPFVALGKGLRAEGHTVRLATHGIHTDLVTSHGLEFAPIEGNPREMFETLTGQAWLDSGKNILKFWREFRKLAEKNVEKSFADAKEACLGSDAILFSFLGAAGYHMAEMLSVPRMMGLLQPFSRTREFPYCVMPELPLGGLYNKATYLFAEQLSWMTGRGWVNRWRKESLGLGPLPIRSPFSRVYLDEEPFLYGFSEHVIPRPRDWPTCHQITGYWFLDEGDSWVPPPELLDFLSSGSKPVYIGFGSMAGRKAEEITDITVEAVTRAGQRAILLGGWADAGDRTLPDSIYSIPSAPHDWLFPKMAAVVHHGGAGTTAAGLRAGVPTLVVPFFADQPFWGKRVNALGAGPQPIARKELTSEKLAAAITQAISDPLIEQGAAAIGEKLRKEDGVDRGVEMILSHFEQ